MKDLFKITGIFALFIIIIPMIGFIAREDKTAAEPEETAVSVTEGAPEKTYPDDTYGEEFSVLDCSTGQIMAMTMDEYIKGAVLGEMPASYGIEALKAQAVAVHTYAVRRMEQQREDPDPELMGAYISNDSSKYQAYFSPEQAKAFYGDDYEEYDRKAAEAVSAVRDEILVYNGEPIVAAFHSISGGRTESAENIWGVALDYLVPVDSEADEGSPLFESEAVFTSDELYARLTQSDFGITIPDGADKAKWIEITETTDSGTVLKAKTGDKELTGMELRALLGLRSPVFTVSCSEKEDCFTFSVKGSGHGVGMSQYGAEQMAESGANYREILSYYYTGAEVVSLNSGF